MDNNGFNYFQNSGYINKRNRKRTLILDVDDSASAHTHLGSGGEFNIQLYEPMIIDKHSEVYLDNFITFNCNIAQSPGDCAFALKINEFNMNSNIASTHGAGPVQIGEIDAPGGGRVPVMKNAPGGQHLFNSIIIPNEHRSMDHNHTTVVHKGKKFNYVCDINPQTISSISGTITDLAGGPIFHGVQAEGQVTYSLTGIGEEGLVIGTMGGGETYAGPIQPYDTITTISVGGLEIYNSDEVGGSASSPGHFLVSTHNDSDELHFTLDTDQDVDQFTNSSGPIVFTVFRSPSGVNGRPLDSTGGGGAGTITLTNGTTTANPNLQLIKGSARFIAEFSIISRE